MTYLVISTFAKTNFNHEKQPAHRGKVSHTVSEPSRPPTNHISKQFVVLCSLIHAVIKKCFLGKGKLIANDSNENKEKIKRAKEMMTSSKKLEVFKLNFKVKC